MLCQVWSRRLLEGFDKWGLVQSGCCWLQTTAGCRGKGESSWVAGSAPRKGESPLGWAGFQLWQWGIDTALWLDPTFPQRAQLTGPAKSYRD